MSDRTMTSDDLVTLREAERLMGLRSQVLGQRDQRRREGSLVDLPYPKVEGRTVRLWSLSELVEWYPRRQDGRTMRHHGTV